MSKSQTNAAPAIASEIAETPLQQFERELEERYPNRVIKRYDIPAAVKQARAIYLMEITSRDEIQASIYADAMMSNIEKASIKLSAEAERRECVRLSIVGVVYRDGTYKHANKGAAFHEIDNWPAKATACLQTYFNDINGVPTSELIEGLRGARLIGAAEPPTNATPASASTGK